jgi:hypothetical protein
VLKNAVFWDVLPCRSCVNRRQPPGHSDVSLAGFSTLKMEAIRSSETSVHTRSTRSHILEDGNLHSHSRENLKFYIIRCVNFGRKPTYSILRLQDSGVHSFISLHSMDPYMAGRPVNIEIVKKDKSPFRTTRKYR